MPIRPNGFHANASKPAALRLTHTRLSPIHDPSTRLPCIPSTARCASSQAYKQNIAVIGGGITGLTTAYVLSKRQDVKVTLYEASKRFGGWIESKLVDVPGDKGRVLFELGPRTLRPSIPNGFITAALAEELGLKDDMLFTSKNSVAARGRYVYFPDRLVMMPHPSMGLWNNIWSILTEPVFRGLRTRDVLNDILGLQKMVPLDRDVSIGELVRNHLGSQVADDLVSAVIHGIYAGDVDKLSTDMIIPHIRMSAVKHQSLVWGAMGAAEWYKLEDAELISRWSKSTLPFSRELDVRLRMCSTFTFRGGMAQLPTRLAEVLKERDNVRFKFGAVGVRRPKDADEKLEVCKLKDVGQPQDSEIPQEDVPREGNPLRLRPGDRYDQVIGTNPTIPVINDSGDISQAFLESGSINATSVGVVNLYYSNPHILPLSGFGYLIPKSVPFDQNPELALGVVFDSDAVHGQDTVDGTKITVMLGGHWWQDLGFDEPPSTDECLKMAKSVVRRHLRINDEPTAFHTAVHKRCIPQYPVGYRQKFLKPDHETLLQKYFGRMKVAGSYFNGVGVSDCVRGAIDVAEATLSNDWKGKTGLEVVTGPLGFAKLQPAKIPP